MMSHKIPDKYIDKAKEWLEEKGYDPGFTLILEDTEKYRKIQFLYIIVAHFYQELDK